MLLLPQVSFWAPAAAGAGVTLVMAYLNGNHIPNLLRFRTMVTKIIGCALGVASGLAIGPEGPMVHIGACIASNITYGTSRRYTWLRWIIPWCRCLVSVRTCVRCLLALALLIVSVRCLPYIAYLYQDRR